jgi:hypothetical protein
MTPSSPPLKFSTALVGPYDHLSSLDKTVVSALIPRETHNRLFKEFIPRRGSVDKVITRFIYALDGFVAHHAPMSDFPVTVRELIINNLLNAFIDHVINIDPTTLLNYDTNPTTTAKPPVYNSPTSPPDPAGPFENVP